MSLVHTCFKSRIGLVAVAIPLPDVVQFYSKTRFAEFSKICFAIRWDLCVNFSDKKPAGFYAELLIPPMVEGQGMSCGLSSQTDTSFHSALAGLLLSCICSQRKDAMQHKC